MASNSTDTSASASVSRSKPSSNRRSRLSSGPSGAAAEPEPPEVPSTRTSTSTSTAATTGYNVRDYQDPDAGAADLALTKGATDKAKTKGKKGGATTVVCFNCGRAAPKLLKCGQCYHAHYCGPEVSLGPTLGVGEG